MQGSKLLPLRTARVPTLATFTFAQGIATALLTQNTICIFWATYSAIAFFANNLPHKYSVNNTISARRFGSTVYKISYLSK